MQAVRFATIGTSPITERFLGALSRVEGAEFVGCHSRDIERARAFGEPRGARLFFDSLDDLASSPDIDAVYIATPMMAHHGQGKALARAGKHLVIEKSICSNAAEASDLFAVAGDAGVVVMEAMRNIHGPGFAAIEATLPELGAIRQATIRFGKRTSRMPRLRAGERLPVFDPHYSSGSLTDIGVYCIEPAVALFGEPTAIDARLITMDVPGEPEESPYGIIDTAGELLLSYADESGRISLVVNVSYGKVADGVASSEIMGEDGTLLWDDTNEPCNVRLVRAVDSGYGFVSAHNPQEPIEFEQLENDMAAEVDDFCRAVRGDAVALELMARCAGVSVATQRIMDEARRQAGVRFPADD